VTNFLWGSRARYSYLFIAALLLLFTLLGARDIWTQEHRWADIVSGMFYRHDFLHPYLGQNDYYDKPLLSYWLIACISKLSGQLTTFELRFPSALAGLIAIASIYRLGTLLRDRTLGLLAGWLLVTTFYFIFWARTSSADMLNVAGSLLAITWYFSKRDQPSFYNYFIFFVIIALTSLCKGLIGAVIPFMAVSVDMLLQGSLAKHLRFSTVAALFPALLIYMLPFLASSYFGGGSYQENGLYLVYRENILRYFHPFDHQGPIYTYFLYLPIYLMPWTLLFLPGIAYFIYQWRQLPAHSRWILCTLGALFLFLTLSGSRRSYYVLPLVPFAILLTADWLLSVCQDMKYAVWTKRFILSVFVLLFLSVDILPAWYYSQTGMERFATLVKNEAEKTQSWDKWNVVLLDAESKINFYLQLSPAVASYPLKGTYREQQTSASLLENWPIITKKPTNAIFITRKRYQPLLQAYFTGYRVVEIPVKNYLPFVKKHDTNVPIAFIPILN